MYNTIANMISKEIEKRDNKYMIYVIIPKIFILILYVKYLCEKKNTGFNYNEIIKDENFNKTLEKLENYNFSPLKRQIKRLKKYIKDTKINKILGTIRYEDIYKLVSEFQEKYNLEKLPALEAFINENDRVAYLNTSTDYKNYDNSSKKITYINNKEISGFIDINYDHYKILDECLKLKRTYTTSTDLKNYDIIIVIDDNPIYKHINDKSITDIITVLLLTNPSFKGSILLKTKYKKISKLTNRTLLKKFLSKVIFFEDPKQTNVIIELNNKEKENISLILVNEKLSNDKEKLKEIISKNKRKKGLLVKIKPEDIINNNFRIGFKMYTLENKNEIKKINEIIDENTRLINELEDINRNVEAEINKLIVK